VSLPAGAALRLQDFPAFVNFDGHITGPAIYQFQQVEARGAIFWEPLLFTIGLAESYRVGLGWATPVGNGFNSLKGEWRTSAEWRHLLIRFGFFTRETRQS